MATYQPNMASSTAYQGQGAAYQGQGTAGWKSKLPALPREVNDLLLWRDWKKSGAVLGACTLLWFFLDSGLSPWTPLQLLAALVGFACPAFVAWSSAAPLLKRQPPPVPALLRDGLSQQQVDDFAERASRSANQALAVAGTLVSGRDIKLSAIVTAGAFIAFKVFGAITLITLTFIVVVLAFTVPKVYEMRKQDIDHVTHTVVTKAKEAHAEVEKVLFKKAPRASTKTE